MIPETTSSDLTVKTQPSYTYYLDIDKGRIYGHCSGIEAVKQAVYKILSTERYNYIIYDDFYGREINALFGKQIYYVVPELERLITEALMYDDRIISVTDFDISYTGDSVSVKFTVNCIYGQFGAERSVTVYV